MNHPPAAFHRLHEISGWLSRLLPQPLSGKAYLVGGLVRDLFLTPAGPLLLKDLDLCLEGNVADWADRIGRHFQATVQYEPRFGTARLFFSTGNSTLHLDIAMARSESYPTSGALPVVSPATIGEDLKRRDFSINAMAYPIVWGAPSPVGLLDPFSGLRDLENAVLRILHPGSFRDDPTRLFRGFRFLLRFGLSWHPETLSALREAVEAGMVQRISAYRIRREFSRIFFAERNPAGILKEIYLSGLMGSLVPGARWSELLERQLTGLDRVLFHPGIRDRPDAWGPEWRRLKEMGRGEILYYLVLFRALPPESIPTAVSRFGLEGAAGRVLSGVLYGDGPIKVRKSHGDIKAIFTFLTGLSECLGRSVRHCEAGFDCFSPDLLTRVEKRRTAGKDRTDRTGVHRESP